MSTISQKQDIAIIYNADHEKHRSIPARYHGVTTPLFNTHLAIVTPTSRDSATGKKTLQHAIKNPLKTSLEKKSMSPQQSISILVIVGDEGLKRILGPNPLRSSDFAHFKPEAKILILSDLDGQAEIAQRIADISQRTVLALRKPSATSTDEVERVEMCQFQAKRTPTPASQNPVFVRTNRRLNDNDPFKNLRGRIEKSDGPRKYSY